MLVIPTVRAPWFLQYRSAIKVSAVSPEGAEGIKRHAYNAELQHNKATVGGKTQKDDDTVRFVLETKDRHLKFLFLRNEI